mgnify:FL=1
MLSHSQLALIHIARSQIDISEEDYRNLLKNNFKVISSKNLTPFQFKKLMEIFENKLGFVRITGELSEAQYRKIRKMCNLLKWNRDRINGFVKRQLGETKAIETLDKSEANKVIEGLKGVSNGKKE